MTGLVVVTLTEAPEDEPFTVREPVVPVRIFNAPPAVTLPFKVIELSAPLPLIATFPLPVDFRVAPTSTLPVVAFNVTDAPPNVLLILSELLPEPAEPVKITVPSNEFAALVVIVCADTVRFCPLPNVFNSKLLVAASLKTMLPPETPVPVNAFTVLASVRVAVCPAPPVARFTVKSGLLIIPPG